MKKTKLLVQNTGLCYEILCRGLVLCSFPTLRLAMERAREIVSELSLNSDIVYIGHV